MSEDVHAPRDLDKNQCLSQNQAIMSTAAQLGGILVAILTFILAFSGTNPEMLRNLDSQFILFAVAAAVVSFFTATTFYLRGTNPEKECKRIVYLNDKGDVFFAAGLLCLLIIPLLLFYVMHLYLAMILCSVSLAVAWFHLFFDEDKVGTVAFRLPIFGLIYRDAAKVHKKARNTSSKWNYTFIIPFYILLIAAIVYAIYFWLLYK